MSSAPASVDRSPLDVVVAVRNLMSMANYLSSQVTTISKELNALRQQIASLKEDIDKARKASQIVAGENVEVSTNPDGSKTIDVLIPLGDAGPETIAPEWKTAVVRGQRISLPPQTGRYLHINVRTRDASWSNSDASADPEVEVYDSENPLEIHLTGF